MEDNEAETVRTLNTYRTVISDLIQKYRGRVVDATGDNIMAEFTSVVDAENCAVEIQRDLAERNAELAYERRMRSRIGVNLGEHQVKNISRPIRVYQVLSFPGAAAHRVVQAKEAMEKKWRKIVLAAAAVLVIVAAAAAVWNYYLRPSPVEPASVEKMAFPLPEKPSIAVIPFTNMSGNPEQEQAIALKPNHTDNHAYLEMSLVFACKPEEAIVPLKKAIRFNPVPPSYYFVKLGRAYRIREQHEAAIEAYKKAATTKLQIGKISCPPKPVHPYLTTNCKLVRFGRNRYLIIALLNHDQCIL